MTREEKRIIQRLKDTFCQNAEKVILYEDGIADVMKLIMLVEKQNSTMLFQQNMINLLEVVYDADEKIIKEKNVIINEYSQEIERLILEKENKNG